MSNSVSREHIARAACLARQVQALCGECPDIVEIDHLFGKSKVLLTERFWQREIGPREGIHTVEVKNGRIRYSYTDEDGVEYISWGEVPKDE